MSNAYTVDGVTITPTAGGYYELTHPSLETPEKVRGKEHADKRAAEIAAEAVTPEGSIPPQPPLEAVAPPPQVAPASGEIEALTALVAKQAQMLEALLAMQATSVETNGQEPPPNYANAVGREFTGQVSAAQRKAAKAKGIEYVTIVLEEGNDIPPTGLFIGHNGNSYMISPGEPVDVPDFLLGVLDDAIMSAPLVDSKSQKILGYRNRMKYPYRRVQ